MSEFMNVGQFHQNPNTQKWRFQKLGYAKPNKNGDGWDIYLDALPMPTATGCRLSMQPQMDRQSEASGAPAGGLADDAIPFAPEVR